MFFFPSVVQHFQVLGAGRPAHGDQLEQLRVGRDESERGLGEVDLPRHDRRGDGTLRGRSVEETGSQATVHPALLG